MISCDKGNTCVSGRGDTILAEWATLTFAVIREFVNCETGATEVKICDSRPPVYEPIEISDFADDEDGVLIIEGE